MNRKEQIDLLITETFLVMNNDAFEQGASDCMEIWMTEDELRKGSSVAFCEICSRTFANKNAFRLHQVKTHNRVCGKADLALFHRKRVTSGMLGSTICGPFSSFWFSLG